MKFWIILLLLTSSCGVKGAPAPRQQSAYIFNPQVKSVDSKKDNEANENEKAKRRTNNRTNNSL